MILHRTKGTPTKDGAGVSLVRVLGHHSAEALNPFLMLDAFDTKNYEDYKAGFPMHPHRGIETITYLHKGAVTHRDSLGHEEMVHGEGVQWMCAGAGILHSEFFDEAPHLQGVQLWLNLPKEHKFAAPAYREVHGRDKTTDYGRVRILSTFEDSASEYTPLRLEVHHMKKDSSMELFTEPKTHSFLFPLEGTLTLDGEPIDEKEAIALAADSSGTVVAKSDLLLLVASAPALHEPIAWGGPIVMNTKEELAEAFEDLDRGAFLP